MLELLDSILDDPQKPYYLVIDRLDENWIEDRLRYLLIRALIETVRDFERVRHVKIIIALRYDLLDRVLKLAGGAGLQEEKYESLYLHLQWDKTQLTKLLDSRIDKLVRQSYTTQVVTHKDVLPPKIDDSSAIDYILTRTFLRPRDVIMFFNLCIDQARDTPVIRPQMVKEAEGEYSRNRLRSLADEWAADYPFLMRLLDPLKGRSSQFTLSEISDDSILELALILIDIRASEKGADDHLRRAIKEIEQDPARTDDFRRWLAAVLYRTGAVGLKLEAFEKVVWSVSGQRSVSISEIQSSAKVSVHPCYWRGLGINPNLSRHTQTSLNP